MGLLTAKRIGITLGLACLIACGTVPDREETAGGIDPAMLRFTDMDGNPHDMGKDLDDGFAVALVFWSPWCEGCRDEAPGISAAEKAHGETIRFYGIVPGTDEAVDDAEVRTTAESFPYDFPQVRDRDLALIRGFEVSGTPTVIVLGPGPQVRFKEHAPPTDWSAFR